MTLLPSLFLSHGSPLHAVDPGGAGAAWRAIAASLPRPRTIVVASAHWETSGFPSVVRIMVHLGMPAHGMGLEKIDQACLERIQKIFLPTLIIHGEQYSLVPLQNARDLYHHIGAEEKELLVIPSATHNDIMFVGLKEYFNALQRFIQKTDHPGTNQGM